MSDRNDRATDKPLARSEQRTPTPIPTRPDLMDFIEDKFDGKDAFPRFLELKIALGPNGGAWKDDIVHQREFKPNQKVPERNEMVELSNKFVSIAQNHCNQLQKPQGFVVLAVNHAKSAHPYGVYYMKLRPTVHIPIGTGNGHGGNGGVQGEDEEETGSQHYDGFMRTGLDHIKENNEHTRYVYDSSQKTTGEIFSLMMELIREQRTANQALESQKLNWYKAMEEAFSTRQDREMAAESHKLKMEMLAHGGKFLMQMVPVVAKSLEARKNGHGARPPAAAANAPITDSAESIAVKQFVAGLTEEQRIGLFGYFNEQSEHVPGAFTGQQVRIFAQVAELQMPASALDLLMVGEHAVTPDQVAKAGTVVPADQFMPLYAIMLERQKQNTDQGVS